MAVTAPQMLPFVMETSTTTGTTDYTLLGAVSGYRSFSVVGDGNKCYYVAFGVDSNGVPNGTGREEGRGTYTLSTAVVSRDAIFSSSSSDAKVSWAAGTRRVYVEFPSVRMEPQLRGQSSATYTITQEDDVIVCDCTSNAITITLLAATARGRNPLRIKKIDSSANAVTIVRAGSDLIDGATSYTLSSQYAAVVLHSDQSANYYVF